MKTNAQRAHGELSRIRGGRSVLAVVCIVVLAAFAPAPTADATTITIVNADEAGVGLNDATPATPVGGNTGTTKGEQALIAFQAAAAAWASLLDSPVEIRVSSSFAALACTAISGTLGEASASGFVWRDFAGAPESGTWYVQALANALFGSDLDPANDDVTMQFNGDVGTPGCLESLSWYYGLDAAAPANSISLLTVALHEIGHGLGFASLVSLSDGSLLSGFPDAYSSNLTNASTGLTYPQMTDAERLSASTATGDLQWLGPRVTAASGSFTGGVAASGQVEMYAPDPVELGKSVSHFTTDLNPDELMEPFYTGVSLTPGLALELLGDIGWPLLNAPVLASLSPTSGPTTGGISLVLSGSDLGASGTVTVGGEDCPAASWTSSSITCTLPEGVGSNAAVVVSTGGLPSNVLYFSYDAPSISGISPTSGSKVGGTSITISGLNFGPSGAATVTIAGAPCAVTSSGHTSVVCTTPVGAVGSQAVLVTAGNQVSGAGSFTYEASPCAGPPAAPANGAVAFSDGNNPGSVATFSCDPDFDLTGASSVECTDDAWPTPSPAPACVAAGAPAPIAGAGPPLVLLLLLAGVWYLARPPRFRTL